MQMICGPSLYTDLTMRGSTMMSRSDATIYRWRNMYHEILIEDPALPKKQLLCRHRYSPISSLGC